MTTISLGKTTPEHWTRRRRERDRLLYETDHWLWPDRIGSLSESDLAALYAYRQALRDFPETNGAADPWPEKPSFMN